MHNLKSLKIEFPFSLPDGEYVIICLTKSDFLMTTFNATVSPRLTPKLPVSNILSGTYFMAKHQIKGSNCILNL
jgi:hypothetical protein